MRARPERICSTSCFSTAGESVVCSIFAFNCLPATRANCNHAGSLWFVFNLSARSFVWIRGFSLPGPSSVRHGVENNVDGQRVGDFLREMLEVIVIVAFPFPPVAVVGVVRGNHHETAFVVENGAVMDSSNVAVVVGFPSHASGLARGADFNVGYL